MTGSDPKVQSVARVIPRSVMSRVRPSSSLESNFGASTIMLTAPIAKPIEMPIVERILCFWIMPIDDFDKKIKIQFIVMKPVVKEKIVTEKAIL